MGDSEEIIQSLDSLWFFSNVLAPLPQRKHNTTVHDTTTAREESPPKHDDPVVQNDRSPYPEPVTVMCPKCGEVSAEVEFQSPRKETATFFVGGQEAENSRSRKEGKQKKRRSRRKVLDARLGMDYYNYGTFMEKTVQKCGFESQMLAMYHKKMPPLNDGLAMKQHLKSWAYAVACTVR